MKIIHVVGARPNFIKVAPIVASLSQFDDVEQIVVHTGQHYSEQMSGLFFKELGMPKPDINLGIGSGPHGQQTGRIMEAFEAILMERMPDVVLVVGDVNSTIACALDAKKLNIPVIHVEAGLRSGDMQMPEEINRLLTDQISDLLFTTERGSYDNLVREGIDPARIHFCGNVMIDSLLGHRERALARNTLSDLSLEHLSGGYGLVTLHRPSNVDEPATLLPLIGCLNQVASRIPLIFPVHPRTKSKLDTLPPGALSKHLNLVEPQGYLDFVNLMARASLVLTDSGGVQEETTILGVPCLTIRDNTERPVTISAGTNRLVGTNPEDITKAALSLLSEGTDLTRRPELWDGQAANRIGKIILDWYIARCDS